MASNWGVDRLPVCLLVRTFVGLLVPYGHLTENEVARRLRTLLAFD